MGYIFSDVSGLAHVAFALLSMLLGPLALLQKKGSKKHKFWGYCYIISMLITNITALLIYRLFDGFGPFHIAAIFGLVSIIAGFIPVYFKRPRNMWLELHYEFMSWSVVGLYAAFWSETFTRFIRIPHFWVLVSTATALTVAIGLYFIKKKKKSVMRQYMKQ